MKNEILTIGLILMMLALSGTSDSDTCVNTNCYQIITTMRMVEKLQKTYKYDKEELQSELATLKQETQAQKMEIQDLKETVSKLHSIGGEEIPMTPPSPTSQEPVTAGGEIPMTPPPTTSQQPVTAGEPAQCELLAECNALVNQIKNLHEDVDGTIIVTGIGSLGITRCSLTGERLDPIPQLSDITSIFNTVVASDGVMWTIGKYELYRLVGGQWEKMFQDEIEFLIRSIDTDSDRNLVVLAGTSGTNNLYRINVTGVPHIVSTMKIPGPVLWNVNDISVLPSGNTAVLGQYNNYCVPIFSQTGTVLNTVGNCKGAQHPDFPTAQILNIGHDSDENILTVSSLQNFIPVYNHSGSNVGNLCTGMLGEPSAVLVTSQGKLVVADQSSKKVKIFNFKF